MDEKLTSVCGEEREIPEETALNAATGPGDAAACESDKALLADTETGHADLARLGAPPYSRSNLLKTLATYIMFFGAGIGYSIYGATILHLEKQTGSTTKHMAYIFTYRALGSITGNVLVGLLFKKVPPEVLLCAAGILFSLTNTAVPFCRSLGLLIGMIMMNGLSMGILGGGCNAYMLKTWRLRTRPFTQALHFIISAGASVSPLIVKTFVTDQLTGKPANLTVHTEEPGLSGPVNPAVSSNITESVHSTTPISNNNLSTSTASPQTVHSMQLFYPFFIGGLCVAVAAVLFAILLATDVKRHIKQKTGGESSVKNFIKLQEENIGPMKHRAVFGMMVVICMVYGGMEYTYGSWILAFCVKHLGVSFQSAALIATAYWGSFAGGRALSVPAARFVSPAITLTVSLLLSTSALLILTCLSTAHIAVTWVCTIITGITFAPIFGNCLTFTQREVNMPSRMTTVFVFMLYLGFIAMPALVGFLFTHFSPICFLYVVTGGSVLTTSLFFAVLVYRHFCIEKRASIIAETYTLKLK